MKSPDFITYNVLESNSSQEDQDSICPCGPYPRLSSSPVHHLICMRIIIRKRSAWYGIASIHQSCVSFSNGVAGYRVQGPPVSTNVTVQNTTRSSGGSCYLSCPFNDPDDDTNYYDNQPCFYAVSISEVIKGNYMVRLNFCQQFLILILYACMYSSPIASPNQQNHMQITRPH